MSHPEPSSFPLWFPFLFVGMWLLMSALFALTGGWLFLARRFRAGRRPEGRRLRGEVRRLGPVAENNITHMIVSDSGLYLYSSLLFRFMRPALLIPWTEVRFVRERRMLWWRSYEFDLGSVTSMHVTRRAYEALRGHAAAASA